MTRQPALSVRQRTRTLANIRLGCAVVLVMSAGSVLPSCGDKNNAASRSASTGSVTSASSKRSADPNARATGTAGSAGDNSPLSEAATNLQDLYKTLGQQQAAVDDPSAAAAAPGASTGTRASDARKPTRISGERVQGPAGGSVAVESASFQAPPPKPPARQVETVLVDRPMNRAELAFRIADRVRVEPGWSPLRQSLAMLGLELIEPGVGGPQVEDLARQLTPEQSRATSQLRRVLGEIATSESLASDPASLASVLSAAARQIAPPPPPASLDLGTVALCTRVESFGRYTPLSSNRIIAGRATRVIVYSEVQNFAQSATSTPSFAVDAPEADSPANAPQNWTVQLGQELSLYLDSDGSRQWHQPEQSVKDSSRSKRADYYLVQLIDLPSNLSVGRYNLKVRVRDKANGAEVERSLPLEVIADPRLITP